MTEEDWLYSRCSLPQMIQCASQIDVFQDRKWLLVGVAFCRLLPSMPVNPQYALDWVEQLADKCGMIQIENERFSLNIHADQDVDYYGPGVGPVAELLRACAEADDSNRYVARLAESVLSDLYFFGIRNPEERSRQATIARKGQFEVVRDIFGNPFRPVTFDPHWRISSVLDLANSIYDQRAFDRMPILADALVDVGCDNDDIIQHCRGPGPHVKGCWVVDLVLGKE